MPLELLLGVASAASNSLLAAEMEARMTSGRLSAMPSHTASHQSAVLAARPAEPVRAACMSGSSSMPLSAVVAAALTGGAGLRVWGTRRLPISPAADTDEDAVIANKICFQVHYVFAAAGNTKYTRDQMHQSRTTPSPSSNKWLHAP